MNSRGIRDASSVQAKNGSHTGIFNTWSTGEAFIGGPTGAILGYRDADGNSFSMAKVVKGGSFELYAPLTSSNRMDVANIISANYFNVKGTNQYLINADNGGGAYIDTMQVSMGIGTASSWINKWIVKSDVTESWNDIDMKGRTITNQSDSRLKTKITDCQYDVFGEAERIRVIEYDWELTNPANKGKPTGRQFGLQAQSTPFLQTKSANDESYLSIDLLKQINFNTLLGKRLNEERLNHREEIQFLKDEMIKIKEFLGV